MENFYDFFSFTFSNRWNSCYFYANFGVCLLFIQNEIMKCRTGILGLTTDEKPPETISMLLDLLNLFISQKENIYADGIIKYFFLEYEESLKAYNLLVN